MPDDPSQPRSEALHRRVGEALADGFYLWLGEAVEAGEVETVDQIDEAAWLTVEQALELLGTAQAEPDGQALCATFRARLDGHFVAPEGGMA